MLPIVPAGLGGWADRGPSGADNVYISKVSKHVAVCPRKRDGLLETGGVGGERERERERARERERERECERLVRALQFRITTILMRWGPRHCVAIRVLSKLLFQPLGGADWVTRTVSVVAQLLRNNWSTERLSIFLSPAPPLCSWSPLGSLEGPAPPPSSWSRLDSVTCITGAARCMFCDGPVGHCAGVPRGRRNECVLRWLKRRFYFCFLS